MQLAINEAKQAYQEDEVPIGCIIVDGDGNVIVKEHNTKIQDNDSTSHAELKALKKAQKILNTKYLYDCTMLVTLEPCAMCAGAIINTRLGKLIYALEEPKTGCCGSVYNLLDEPKFNHKVVVEKGIKREEVLKIMQDFFRQKRGKD